MIKMRRAQLTFGDGLIAAEVHDLREDWMPYADEVLADEQLVMITYAAWRSDARRAVAAAGRAPRPRWCCAC